MADLRAGDNDDEKFFRHAWPVVYARAVRFAGGDFDRAEDATAEAFARAVAAWSADERPSNPLGWLVTTMKRHVIDEARKRATHERQEHRLVASAVADSTPSQADADVLDLFMTCAHPALNSEAQVALTLRSVAGLRPAEIARAFHVSPSAIEKRLVRARRKIRESGVPFRTPGTDEFEVRLTPVIRSILLLFNEGYAPTSGDAAFRQEFCDEAIYLGRRLRSVLVDNAEVAGMLAVMLFMNSRRASRIDDDGQLVALRFQDRSAWDGEEISEGIEMTLWALQQPARGDYVLQAVIGALHAEAPSHEATDWKRIAALYHDRLQLLPSPTVELGRVVAVAEAEGPNAANVLLAGFIPPDERTTFVLHTVKARIAELAGQINVAVVELERARELAPTTADVKGITLWISRIGALS